MEVLRRVGIYKAIFRARTYNNLFSPVTMIILDERNYRRKPTTGTRCPTLFDKWHGILYKPSCTDTAGHTMSFDYPVMDDWGESQSTPAQGRFETPTCRSTVEHAIHQTAITAPSQRINYTAGPQRGDLLPIGGPSAKTAPPRVGHRSPGGLKRRR